MGFEKVCQTPFYRNIEHIQTNLNVFIYWWSNLNTIFLASNKQTSNLTNRALTRFTKLLIELTGTSFFRTSNELERVHLMVIELEHPIFAFERSNIERSNIELRTLFDPSLAVLLSSYLYSISSINHRLLIRSLTSDSYEW